MADITLSVSNTNLLTLTNNETSLITYDITRTTCKGNSLVYVSTDSSGGNLPSNDIESNTSFTYQFIEDGLYKLTLYTSPVEVYYIRVTGNLEACERALIQDVLCYSNKCDKFEYNIKIGKEMNFQSFKIPLFSRLNIYQQEQSIFSLITPSYADQLSICQDFCLIADLCGCVETKSYTTVISDCGCSK